MDVTQDSKRRYKWFVSALQPSWARGLYLKLLEPITPNARVPFVRIMVALLVAAMALVGALRFLFEDTYRAQFVAVPTILMIIGVFLMVLVFMLSTHDGSMLIATARLNLSKLDERRRTKKSLKIKSLGLQKIEPMTGIITFNNGDVGAVYAVKGQLSLSTLPDSADFISDRRAAYEIARTATGQEMRITSVEPNPMKLQLADLEKIKKLATQQNDVWRARMAEAQMNYIDGLLEHGNQLTMLQTVIIRDIDMEQLKRSCLNFERSANSGMYETCHLIQDKEEIINRLAGLCMMERR